MERYTIRMREITPDYFPSQEGLYLVQTESEHLKRKAWLPARVTISVNADGKKKYNIDISNQRAKFISLYPLKD